MAARTSPAPTTARALPRRVRVAAFLLFALLGATVAAHLAYTCFDVGRESHAEFFDRWPVPIGLVAVIALCLLRAAARPRLRSAWLALAGAALLWIAGGLYYALMLSDLSDPPFPSWADAGFLGAYPATYASVMLLIRRELRRAHPSVWLDGLIGALATSAVVAGLLVGPIVAAAEGSVAAVVTNIAYPVGDLLLLMCVVGACALTGWRPGRGWQLLGLSFIVLALTDTVYLFQLANGTYELGTPLESGWLVAFALFAVAAWQPSASYAIAGGALDGTRILVVPIGFVVLALGVLVASAPLQLPQLATGLAAAAIVASAWRLWLSFREVHALASARHEAITDDLTGLPNRRQLFRRLHATIAAAAAERRSAALLLIDLDHFKELNDTLGHHAGDLLLRQVGPRLRGVVGDGEIARLGGDEFAVVLDDTAAAETVAARLGDALREPFDILDVHLRIDASIGIAHYPAHGTTPEALMQRADIAMYQAKTARRGHQTYAEAADHSSRERLELMSQLPEAIDNGEILLHYQPLVDVESGTVATAEALVRWQHPQRGLLMPGAFLAFAEQSAVMHRLTLRVLDLALAQCARWREEGESLKVAVNVSATNLLDAEFPGQVRAALGRHGVAPGALQLEITEDGVMTDPEKAVRILAELCALGIELAIDDYGTGYSSLAYLKRLPVDELKIDRSFVTHLPTDRTDRAIVRSTVELARTLGIRVVAEGVEDAAALRVLRELGADIAQGYHFTRPLPAEELTDWVRARRHAARPDAGAWLPPAWAAATSA